MQFSFDVTDGGDDIGVTDVMGSDGKFQFVAGLRVLIGFLLCNLQPVRQSMFNRPGSCLLLIA